MKKQVKIRIRSDGKIEAETVGMKGKTCTKYKGILEQLLEARTSQLEYTEEYHQIAIEDIEIEKIQEERK